jgi:ATP-dependent helicase/nuclease subunit B
LRAQGSATGWRSDTIAGVNRAILASLADGAAAVTPNRRLARALRHAFDAEQLASGLSAWPTPSILPYQTWLATLWEQSVATGATDDETLLLTPPQATLLWEQVVDADEGTLLNPHGAAALAAEAWTLVHAWGAGGESWRAWRRDDRQADDPSLFASWAERYGAALHRSGMLDVAQLADTLAALAPRVASLSHTAILAGFVEFTPQQERLFTALSNEGAMLRRLDTLPSVSARVRRTTAISPREELIAALTWARGVLVDAPGARVGIVVEDLVARRDELIALAEDILCPSSILPAAPSSARPFEVSLGSSLGTIPLVVAALDLIELAESRLAVGAAAALLRSPYLPGADLAWAARAAIERDWLEASRRDVTLADAVAALNRRAPALAAQWRKASATLEREPAASPRNWADGWRRWLTAAGWPGPRTLDSAEYQAREAWERLLLQFSSLGAVVSRMSRSTAVDKLRAMSRETLFQPEGSAAPVQILGILEASGMAFDALWVVGLASDRWPPAPEPNPMLPIAWQRERQIPRANSSGELAFARALTTGFAAAATEVVFSSASTVDDRSSSPSALIAGYPEWSPPALPPTWARMIAANQRLESIADDQAPRFSPGSIAPGGSHIIAAQSDCPFQAVARHRLDAKPWPVPLGSLSPQERGTLAHLAMAAFWTAARDHATLLGLDSAGETRLVESAVETALVAFPAVRWRSLPTLVRAAEVTRLARLLHAWLQIEGMRPPFAVLGVEATATVELASLTFRIRSDRIDSLADGGIAIIDFKTGRAERPAQWFDARPRATQLGMYVLAERDAQPDIEVRAAAYAQLRPDAVTAVGLAADANAWPALTRISACNLGDWQALEAWWRSQLGALASEIASGNAIVSPRQSPLACRMCLLQPLCRIQSVRSLVEPSLDDE